MTALQTYPETPLREFRSLCSMPEEDERTTEGEGAAPLNLNQDPQEWSFNEEEEDVALSSSPSMSIRSSQSSPSEIGGGADSGVCSEHDTPPLNNRKQHLAKKSTSAATTAANTSDSDNDSSVSSTEVTTAELILLRQQHHDSNNNNNRNKVTCRRKTTTQVASLPSLQPTNVVVPDNLLREIKEKWRELKKKRQSAKGDPGDRSTSPFTRTSSFQRSGRLSVHSTNSSFSTLSHDVSSLSLADSSNYSSMTSLCTTEDEDYFPSYGAGGDYYKRPLFECKDESASSGFAGLHDIFAPQQESTIKSSKGTVRGVKNRVRAGIATFTSDHRFLKIFTERERGKVVIYVTTLGVIRETFERCLRLRKILWTLLIHFEERDIFMSRDTQIQLLDRLRARAVSVPHVFLEGQYLGSIDLIEKLNENGELRKLLQSYMRPASQTPCSLCGGFRLLPCSVCSGSKKSVHRNNFTLEFVALKCGACDESGLVACRECHEEAP